MKRHLISLWQAQGLHQVITTSDKLLQSQHRLHVLTEGDHLMGILKTGVKKLFVRVTLIVNTHCEHSANPQCDPQHRNVLIDE